MPSFPSGKDSSQAQAGLQLLLGPGLNSGSGGCQPDHRAQSLYGGFKECVFQDQE